MIELTGKKRILFIRLGKIGDIIIASSVFYEWKRMFPQNQLTLVTLIKNKEVLKYNKDLHKVYFIKNRAALLFQILKFRAEKFELLIDLNDDPSTTSSLLRRFVSAKKTAGFKFSEKNIPDISIAQPLKSETHIIERAKALIKSISKDFENSELKPTLYLGEKESYQVDEELKNCRNDKKIVSINISAGAPIRYWPEKKWIELISRVCTYTSEWLFIFLAEKKDEHKKESIISQVDKNRIVTTRNNSFQHYAAYIKHSDILITPDTAAVHIASAFNVPVIAIYPNYEWNYKSWQPLSTHYKSIKANEENISNVSVEEIYESFINLASEI